MDRRPFTNFERLHRLLENSDFDAIVVHSPENGPYFSGFYNLDLRLLPEAPHMAVWARGRDPVYIAPFRGPGFGPVDPFIEDTRFYQRGDTPMVILADVLSEMGVVSGRVGLEMSSLPTDHFLTLTQMLPNTMFADCADLIARIKMVKTPAEIDLLRRAARITAKAIRIGYEMARSGDTEKSVINNMGYVLTQLGADIVAFNVAASGPRTLMGHHHAEEVALQEGDLYRVDFGGLFSGYFTDLARMAVVGEPSRRQQETYQKCVALQNEMVAALRPGVVPRELFAESSRQYEVAGLPSNRSLFGHSIGLHVHERPDINAFDELPLEAGMVVCIEHGWTDEANQERYHVEDMYLITDQGPQLLSDYGPIEELYVIDGPR